MSAELSDQIQWLFILAIPVACIAWTVTHEDIFKEPRDYCVRCSKQRKTLVARKFFYLFTCEYCFSHYVTLAMIFFTDYKLLLMDWRGHVIAGFAIVWIANVYMSLFGFIRVGIKKERVDITAIEEQIKKDTDK